MKPHWHELWKLAPFLVAQFGFDFGDLAAILQGYLAAFLDFLLQVVVFIWNVLIYVANYIWAALNFIGNFFYQLALDIARAFKWIWESVIKVALTKLVNLFVTVRAWLQKVFGPVIRYLQKIRKWVDWAFNKYVRPVLNMIQHIRQFLTLFRLLGFQWAKKLDAFLAKIQRDILKAYTLVRAELNKVISYLQIIADPSAILRRNPLFAAIIRSAGELRNVLLTVEQRDLAQEEIDAQSRDRARASKAGQQEIFQSYYSQGKIPPDMEQVRKEFDAEFKALQAGGNAP